jgi:transposase-like protein
LAKDLLSQRAWQDARQIELIRLAVWFYFRFTTSLRGAEEPHGNTA